MFIQVNAWEVTHTHAHTHTDTHTHTHPLGPNNQAPSIRTNSRRLPGQAPSPWKPSLYSKPVLLCLVWRFSHRITFNKDQQTKEKDLNQARIMDRKKRTEEATIWVSAVDFWRGSCFTEKHWQLGAISKSHLEQQRSENLYGKISILSTDICSEMFYDIYKCLRLRAWHSHYEELQKYFSFI